MEVGGAAQNRLRGLQLKLITSIITTVHVIPEIPYITVHQSSTIQTTMAHRR